MQYTRPDYYEQFSCVGGACPDTCCAGWQIVIDPDSLKRYKNIPGPFGNRLRNEIDWKNGVFKQYKGDCCFLNEEKLCDIYGEIGEEQLCKTCGSYPRYIEEFEGVREQFLCMSCPVVAEMLLGREEKTTLRSFDTEEEETEDYEFFDYFLYTKLEDSRHFLLSLLQNRHLKIELRLSMLLGFGHDFQRRIREGKLFQVDSLIEKYEKPDAVKFFQAKKASAERKKSNARFLLAKTMFQTLKKLEIRKPEWKGWLTTCQCRLLFLGAERYRKKRKQFLNEHDKEAMALFQEQIAVYFLLHYYCGAVYDERVYAKTKLAVLSAFLLEEMLFIKWLGDGKNIQKEDWVYYTYQYARELEHSDENLKRMENMLCTDRRFAIRNITEALCE